MGKVTKEERVANALATLLSDLRLDLDLVGMYLGRYSTLAVFKRLEHIYEVAQENQKAAVFDRESHYEKIRSI